MDWLELFTTPKTQSCEPCPSDAYPPSMRVQSFAAISDERRVSIGIDHPATLSVFATGLGVMAWLARRRKKEGYLA
jgi:hypothetical protein